MSAKHLRRSVIPANKFTLVHPREHFHNPCEAPLRIGDVVSLNSGSPVFMIVDLYGSGDAVVSWRSADGGVHERLIPLVCIHRVSLI